MRQRVLVFAALVATILTFLGSSFDTGASASTPVTHSPLGIGTHDFWLGTTDSTADLTPLVNAGVTRIRDDFMWNAIEPTKGNFDWSKSDALMTTASKLGIDVLPVLAYNTPWNAPGGDTLTPPTDQSAYANFVAQVVKRYSAGGTFWTLHPTYLPAPITAVEIWNEPYGWWFWHGSNPDPVAYGRLVHLAADAVNAVNPTVDILAAGELYATRSDGKLDSPWLGAMLAADPALASLVDVWSVHPYTEPKTKGPNAVSSDPRWDFRRINNIRQTLKDHGVLVPRMWITEIGWTTASGSTSGVTEANQAAYLADAIDIAMSTESIERLYTYQWAKDGTDTTDIESFFGVRHRDGTYKPAWFEITSRVGILPLSAPVTTSTTTSSTSSSTTSSSTTISTTTSSTTTSTTTLTSPVRTTKKKSVRGR